LKPWIDFNTNKRATASNEFQKDLFKLMNNAVFGKTMENVRNHINFELVSSPERFEKVINSPYYKHSHIINDNLVGVEKTRAITKLNKPIYVGMSILDLSKLHMYQSYYDVIKPKYGDKVRLAYTDTDSFILKVETEDLYKDLKNMGDYFDFSNYAEDHDNYDLKNNKKLGYFKDEMAGQIMREYVGLKPKMYSYDKEEEEREKSKEDSNEESESDEEEQIHNKAKGVPMCKAQSFVINDHIKTLYTNDKKTVNFNRIRSFNHTLYTINCNKLGLSSYDNKRYWIDNVN
jgi:hypothetical protein